MYGVWKSYLISPSELNLITLLQYNFNILIFTIEIIAIWQNLKDFQHWLKNKGHISHRCREGTCRNAIEWKQSYRIQLRYFLKRWVIPIRWFIKMHCCSASSHAHPQYPVAIRYFITPIRTRENLISSV